jgi:hypothetical protein
VCTNFGQRYLLALAKSFKPEYDYEANEPSINGKIETYTLKKAICFQKTN